MTRIFPTRGLLRGLSIIAVGLALGGTAHAASSCADPRERNSITVRTLQTQFMVAALSCGAREEYNAFVTHYRPHLSDHGRTLKRYFQRAYGGGSQRALDHYVTELANQASRFSIADRTAFCSYSVGNMNRLLSASPEERARLLRKLAEAPEVAARDPAPACETLTQR
jgi:hypothetical protein